MPLGNEETFQALEKTRIKPSTPESLHSTQNPQQHSLIPNCCICHRGCRDSDKCLPEPFD